MLSKADTLIVSDCFVVVVVVVVIVVVAAAAVVVFDYVLKN